MADRGDLKRIEQRVWRDTQQDGLLEILIGLLFIITSTYWAKPAIGASFAAFFLFSHRILEALRKRYTYPRIGYAELIPEEPKQTLRGIAIYALVVFAAMALILLVVGRIADVDTWLRWLPTLTGAVISGGFIYAAGKSGAVRYYVFVGLAVGLGVAFSAWPTLLYKIRMLLYMSSLGVVFLASGSVMFARFLRRYPVLDEEESPDASA